MNEPEPIGSEDRRALRPVFISYATAERRQALSVCSEIERRGARCWIACRDVAPGHNYQEEIVRSVRTARAVVLVFSEAANNSDEIKKELSIASRHHIPVMALRIEDVEPSDAFAYELSTQQWIDAFDGWDEAIDALVRCFGQGPEAEAPSSRRSRSRRRTPHPSNRWRIASAAIVVLLAIAAGLWWLLRPAPAAAHSMMVRLAGFQRLSPELPTGITDAVRDEIAAAFGDQGLVGVSTAPAPDPGSAPAYALGGTIRRDGDKIRVITRLTNERSGVTLWSTSSDYDAAQLPRVPRRIAVDAAKMARCGLFAASTYRKPLPDLVLADYMQFCQTTAVFQTAPLKGFDSARKVTAAAPDFSWGWSAVATAASLSRNLTQAGSAREEVLQAGLRAADKALSLDSRNSEALAMEAMLIDANDRIGQEKLLKRAIEARPLDCGCEHLLYGLFLENAGRFSDAAQEFGRAVDMLALDEISQFRLADSLVVTGRQGEAKQHFDAAIDLSQDPQAPNFIAYAEASETGDYRAAIKAVQDPKLELPETQRSALLAAFQAMESGNQAAKARAAGMLAALPADEQDPWSIKLLAALGASRQALDFISANASSRFDWPTALWYPSMRGALNDPKIPALLQRLGLTKYWRTSGTRPDVCTGRNPPPFCRMI